MMRIRCDTVDIVAQKFVSYETARLCPKGVYGDMKACYFSVACVKIRNYIAILRARKIALHI